MQRFAELLDRLVLTPSRNGKLTLLVDYFRSVEDPDRGLALAAITGDLDIASVKPAMLRTLVMERMDPVLFSYSYDSVGDLAEIERNGIEFRYGKIFEELLHVSQGDLIAAYT